jgi:feruloyl esterase
VKTSFLASFTVRALLLWQLPTPVLGQNGSEFKDWSTTLDTRILQPTRACAALRDAHDADFTVTSVDSVGAAADAPAHCRIRALASPELRFEVDLPVEWNGRLYVLGNGGFGGEPLDAPQVAVDRNAALRHGFAVAFSNAGHDGRSVLDGTFAVDHAKLIDFAFLAVHRTVSTARTLILTYYGQRYSRAYFNGCSTGGRQGLIAAQRYPEDFDGILVGAPMLDYVGTMISTGWIDRGLRAAPIPSSKLETLAAAIYRRCDALDGLSDGLIDDPRRCDFRASRDLRKCRNAEDDSTCFTPGQLAALERLYGNVRSAGAAIFPGWPVGGEIEGANPFRGLARSPLWVPMLINDDGPSWSVAITRDFFRYVAFGQANATYDLNQFDFDADPPRLASIRALMDATDADLSNFKSRGGKIVMYFGWADPALNPLMGVTYYDRVRQRMGGATSDFFRLFMVPGMSHCSGGVGPSAFDALTPLVGWVEHATPPERIEAAELTNGTTTRTRPLCPYPAVARYAGGGSPNLATSFTCRSNVRR